MKLNISSFSRPLTLPETFQIMDQKRARVMAGGTDLLPAIRDGRLRDVDLVDITQLGLNTIRADAHYLYIGSTSTHSNIYENELINNYIPPLAQACRKIGSKQIQNKGTIGGNIMNASPAGDTLPVLIAASADVVLANRDNERVVSLESLFLGPGRTILSNGEILKEIRIPKQRWTGEFIKIGKRTALAISVASVAILQDEDEDIYVSCGSVDATVKRCLFIERVLGGAEKVQRDQILDAVIHDTSAIDDIRASADYRQIVLANMIYQYYRDHLMED